VRTNSFDPLANVWYHLAVTRNGNAWALYANGNKIAEANDTSSVPDPVRALWIGNAELDGSHGLLGSLDDVRIYNRALSALEIRELYTVPIPPSAILLATGLIGMVVLKKRR
jgi:hypothetical protein